LISKADSNIKLLDDVTFTIDK